MNDELQKGDYVLVTKYSDGDPYDHWFVGFYSHTTGDRHHVTDGQGQMPRQNGFRRIQKIDEPIGRWFVENKDDIKGMTTNIWDLLAMKISEQPAKSP